jgi:Heliorhodopsin
MATKTNWVRWAEYSLSAGAMVWVIATLSGVTELRTLLALLVLNVALQYIGFLVEGTFASAPSYKLIRGGTAMNQAAATTANPNNLTFVGWLVFLAMWIEIGVSFFSAIEYDSVRKPPDMVYAIVIVLFVLFSTFGALQLAYVNDLISSFFAYELGFICLSFVSKTLLTWMVYGGVVNAGRNMDPN